MDKITEIRIEEVKDYEIPKFLREETSAKDLRKQAKEIPKQ